ncbi:MAG: choice-of-anchor Q domain-containing protein [Anaerolineae bacterium]
MFIKIKMKRLFTPFIAVSTLAILMLAALALPVSAAVNCADSAWPVGTEADLNGAIACYNAKGAGSYTITLTQNIDLTASTTTIDNSTASTSLILEGGGFTVDGQNGAGVRPFDIAASTVVTMQNVSVVGGNVTGSGGGILNVGTLNLIKSTVRDNTATVNGGGIASDNNDALSITDSTISGNTASGNGGGVFVNFTIDPVSIVNSTISQNGAASGGGIFVDFIALTLSSSTLYSNSASSVNGGGGIFSNDTLTVDNTIIAKSTNGDCFSDSGGGGSIVKVGSNIVEDNSCTFTGGSDPKLGPLQDNSGSTFTHALLTGSPAIDMGATALTTDQIGTARPQGAADDIGAFELVVVSQETLTVTKDGLGSGAVASIPAGIDCGLTCTFDYDANSVVTLTATSEAGSTFTGWSGGASGSTNPITVTLDAAKAVTATFGLESYAVAVATDGLGSGSVAKSPDAATYVYGTVVTLTATANGGSSFAGWSGDASGNSNPITITVDAAKAITATFDLDAVVRYTVTTAMDGTGSGTIVQTPMAADYASGTVITLTATADGGSNFAGWSGDASGSSNPITITVDAAKAITATFDLNAGDRYTVTTATDGTGSGTVVQAPMAADYAAGTVITLTATADGGSSFAGWSGDASGSSNPITITMDAAKAITATFDLIPVDRYTVTTITAGTGVGTVVQTPVAADYAAGTVITLTATADAGSSFSGWTGDASGSSNPITITVDAAKAITATFTLGTNVLSVNKGGTGSGVVTSSPAGIDCGAICALNFDVDTMVTLIATADADSTFTGWSGAGCSGTEACVVTLSASMAVTAEFTTIPLLKFYLPSIYRQE